MTKPLYGQAFNEDWEDPLTIFQRVNVHTGEIEDLFEIEVSLRLHKFVNEHQIFISDQTVDWVAGRVHTHYGILDLQSGETHLFNREDFAIGSLDFKDLKVLISNNPSLEFYSQEVVIFDFENMTSELISLEEKDVFSTRFSYDGHHFVTINGEESVFRKYDLSGVLVVELELDLPRTIIGVSETFEDEIFHYGFEIFPISEDTYVLHINVLGTYFGNDHHIQIITIP